MKSFSALAFSGFIATAAFGAIVEKPVAYEHAGVKCVGRLAYDDSGDAKRPGVLVVPEWWGVNDYAVSRARQLAEMGYVAFVADIYGDGKSTEDGKQAGAWAAPFHGSSLLTERTRAGLDVLMKEPRTDASKVAAIGFCFGGSAVQALAYSGAPVKGVVSFHGGLVPVPAGAGAKTVAKLLILNGASDPTVKPEAIAAFVKDADAAKLDFQFVNYAGALHAFSNPDATTLAAKNGMAAMVGYQEAAARRSWTAMTVFLDEIFAGK